MKKLGKKRNLERMTVNAYACQCACNCSCNCSCSCSCSCGWFIGYAITAAQNVNVSNSQYNLYRAGAATGMGGGIGMSVAGGYR